MKNIRIFYLKIYNFLVAKFSVYLNKRAFVMIIAYICNRCDSILLHDVEQIPDLVGDPKQRLNTLSGDVL